MAPIVIYTPEKREINLADPSEFDYALIASLHDQRPRRGSRVLLCRRAGFADREMIIRLNPGSLSDFHAAHYPGEGHEGGHPISRPETDEHKRQKEYWRRAVRDAGLTVAEEVFVRGAGTMDVVITGDGLIPTDVEVQHSPQEARLIKRRTLRYHAAGYLPVWFSDRRDRPAYLATVPGLSCDDQRWREYTPARRTVWAIGLGHIRRELRCEVGAFERYRGRCPASPRRNPCGQIHPEITAGVAGLLQPGELIDLPRPRPASDPGPGATVSGRRAWHPRQLAGLPELRNGYCPGCRTAWLTRGRELCQACSMLTIMGYPPPGLA